MLKYVKPVLQNWQGGDMHGVKNDTQVYNLQNSSMAVKIFGNQLPEN